NLVRTIAGENHSAVHEAIDAATLEAVERYPFELEIVMSEHFLETRTHDFGALLVFGICIRRELKVDSPDIIGLLVQECRLTGMEWRFEPEPPFGPKFGRHLPVPASKLLLQL